MLHGAFAACTDIYVAEQARVVLGDEYSSLSVSEIVPPDNTKLIVGYLKDVSVLDIHVQRACSIAFTVQFFGNIIDHSCICILPMGRK